MSHLQKRDIVLVDWDDTLLPSSAIQAALVSQKPLPNLTHHEVKVLEFLKVLNEIGDVCIVTNAEKGWVEQSACRFMPQIVPIIKTVPIFSARHFFEQSNPSDPLLWKVRK